MYRSLIVNTARHYISKNYRCRTQPVPAPLPWNVNYRCLTQCVPAIPPWDVFINHRGSDTKRTVSGLLYDHFSLLKLRPFLDSKSMKPGDNLFEKINSAIHNCKVAIAVFSPHYCESYFCLHELALIMKSKKKVIPVFCDVQPSELRVMGKELRRFTWALEETRCLVGLNFNTSTGNWSDLITTTSDIVMKSLIEAQGKRRH